MRPCHVAQRGSSGVTTAKGWRKLQPNGMRDLGYGNVTVLNGGIAAWETAGFVLYSGVHVPSKAFAEVVEHSAGTPWITVEELNDWIAQRKDMVLLDSRSYEEFHGNSIPTALSVPGAELVYRFADLVPSPSTTVVVNCGGRTRSIIGAQSLINAGFPNKIVSLKNGTQAWHLAGFEILKGVTARAPAVSVQGHDAARQAAQRVVARFGIQRIDEGTLAQWQQASADRTLYVFDVRSPEEYVLGHIPGMKNVPGGQLIQETDRHAVTWGARVVLVDDDGVRAVMTAHWMKQMGWEVSALTMDLKARGTEKGTWQPNVLGLNGNRDETIDAATLQQRIASGGISVIDVEWSRDYIAGHIPGAWFAIRARMDECIARLSGSGALVLTSSDGRLARLALTEAIKFAGGREILVLDGGTEAWRGAGFALESGPTRMGTAPEDVRLKAREENEKVEEAMKAYLAWEINLVNQMATDDDKRFSLEYGNH